jgi:hypothetical protein
MKSKLGCDMTAAHAANAHGTNRVPQQLSGRIIFARLSSVNFRLKFHGLPPRGHIGVAGGDDAVSAPLHARAPVAFKAAPGKNGTVLETTGVEFGRQAGFGHLG